MPNVGPELPPHLSKRKRSIDDAEPPNSPPHKVQAAAAPTRTLGPTLPPPRNPDEVDIDDSSEDDYGPSLQASKPSKASPPARVLGPTPPSNNNNNPDELAVDSSSDDDNNHGPALPSKPSKPSPPKRILGPSLPPAPLSTMPPDPPSDSDSDSDDEYAPALPPAPGSLAAQLLQEQQALALTSRSAPEETPKQRRAEWMLVPPSANDSSRADPTQLKARKFASSRSSGPVDKSVSAIWTETPEEKRKRLEDEVLGRVEAATSGGGGAKKKDGRGEREDRETERRIREYNERNRGKSLYETHKGAGAKEEEKEDDPSKRAFDREKDMALSGRLGHGQKREMLSKAADFGSRFQKGKFL